VASRFPESTFGEISRIVGNEWRSLSGIEKQGYEERAAKLNEETTARLALEALGPGETPHQDLIFECHWDSCDYQFEELNDLLEHAVGEPEGHVQKHFVTKPGKLKKINRPLSYGLADLKLKMLVMHFYKNCSFNHKPFIFQRASINVSGRAASAKRKQCRHSLASCVWPVTPRSSTFSRPLVELWPQQRDPGQIFSPFITFWPV